MQLIAPDIFDEVSRLSTGACIIGFVAGIIAKFIHPGPNEPSGFILTTLLGIAGAFVATYLGQKLGWYQATSGERLPVLGGDGAGPGDHVNLLDFDVQ